MELRKKMKRNFEPDFLGQTQDERDKIAFEMQKSPFKNWIQVNEDGLKHLMVLNSINPLATNILYFLIENANNYNAVIISQKSLSLIFNKSTKTVNLAIKILKEHNFINIQKDGRGNMYFVNANLMWKSYGTNYKFAEFNAKIIFSQEELKKMNFKETLLKKGQNVITRKSE